MTASNMRTPSPFTMTAHVEPAETAGIPRIDNPVEVFKPGGSTNFIQAMRLFVAQQNLDISTDEGKDFVRSFAYQLVRTRTTGLKEADKLIESDKKHIAEVNSEKKFFETEMLKIQHAVRGPLTAWEDRDKERQGAHEAALGQIFDACLFIGTPTIQGIKDRLTKLDAFTTRQWEEFEPRAISALEQAKPALQAKLETAEKAEADRIELEESREKIRKFEAEQAEQKRMAREAEIAKEATARAEAKAEEVRKQAETKKTLWLPPSVSEAVSQQLKQTAPMTPAQVAPEPVKDVQSISGWPVAQEMVAQVASEPSALTLEEESLHDLADILDYDQASDVLAAIKAGKIRHVQIVY